MITKIDIEFNDLIIQGLSFLLLEITLPLIKLCYAFEEKLFFLLP